jgi:hypothetical protein
MRSRPRRLSEYRFRRRQRHQDRRVDRSLPCPEANKYRIIRSDAGGAVAKSSPPYEGGVAVPSSFDGTDGVVLSDTCVPRFRCFSYNCRKAEPICRSILALACGACVNSASYRCSEAEPVVKSQKIIRACGTRDITECHTPNSIFILFLAPKIMCR